MEVVVTTPLSIIEMPRGVYSQLRGEHIPPEPAYSDEGYLVEYPGAPNHPDYAGYITWIPKELADTVLAPVEAP